MTIDLSDLGSPFNAKWTGSCTLKACERDGVIEQGDVAQHISGEIYHMSCARRVMRQQVAPLCKSCWCYHNGDCA